MVHNANMQVGDRFSQSSTNIHLLEIHSGTIGWAAGIIVLLAAFTFGLRWHYRRKYKKRFLRRQEGSQVGVHRELLALTHEDGRGRRCECCRTHTRDDVEAGTGNTVSSKCSGSSTAKIRI